MSVSTTPSSKSLYWLQVLDEYSQSGLTVKQFCAQVIPRNPFVIVVTNEVGTSSRIWSFITNRSGPLWESM